MNKLAELDALYEAATPGEWYPRPNDLIGGWCVMNVDKPPSKVDNKTEFDVADFISEPAARHIAALHNSFPALRAVVEAAVEFRDAWNVDSSVRMQVAGQRLRDSVAALEGETK